MKEPLWGRELINSVEKLHMMLIPYPQSIIYHNEKTIQFMSLDVDWEYSDIEYEDWLKSEWDEICNYFSFEHSELSIPIRLNLLHSKMSEESYSIDVKGTEILISSSNFAGFFYAFQTIRQMVVILKNGWYEMPECSIIDEPKFPVRGVMLDVGRNFMSIDFLKQIVRRLSHYKINMLHLHLTDNPGWRIESKVYPSLTDSIGFWPTRQPGKFYTLQELKELVNYCAKLNVRVMPEIDMPGHSESFTKTMKCDMQSEKGLEILKNVLDETISVFPDPWFHIGADEVNFTMENFMPEIIHHLREMGKEVVLWSPGYVSDDSSVIRMCWGENEMGYSLDKSTRFIDCNGFYLDWMDSQAGVPQIFFQQPCEESSRTANALGSIMCVWTDGALSKEKRILEQYPFYPCMLAFAERIWRGNSEKRRDLMAQLPTEGTKEWFAFSEFENRLIYHRDHFFKDVPFPYVKQSNMKWRLIGLFDHQGVNNYSFEPEYRIKKEYVVKDTVLRWQEKIAYGGVVQIRSLYDMFNAHKKVYKLNHWPTLMSPIVGNQSGTCYALTYIISSKEQDVWLMFGLNGMWGHSGGYRSGRAPEKGSWDYEGGDIWLNDKRVNPPIWPFKSLPWTGWGHGRIENPLTQEGYFYRPPIKIHLKKGRNKILIRSVSGPWRGDTGDRKWQFCCMPVLWDGLHYKEVPDLEYEVGIE